MKEWKLLCSIKAVPKKIKAETQNFLLLCNEDIPGGILQQLLSMDPFTRHLLCTVEDDDYFILERYGRCHWIAYHVDRIVADEILADNNHGNLLKTDKTLASSLNSYDKGYEEIDFNSLLKLWEYDPRRKSSDISTINLLMKPPYTSERAQTSRHAYPQVSHKSNTLSSIASSSQREPVPKERLDPREYLNLKYYESLFSFGTPLAYFVKSSLVRFTNLCRAKFGEEYKLGLQTILLDLILNIGDFNKRYSSPASVLAGESSNLHLLKSRANFISKYNIKVTDTTTSSNGVNSEDSSGKGLNDIATLIKAREIKLQIVLLLEIIRLNRLDSNFKDFEGKYETKLKGRSRNIIKNNFVWGKLRLPLENSRVPLTREPMEQAIIPVDFCEELDLYLDQLSILEMMLDFDVGNSENNGIDAKSKDVAEIEDAGNDLKRYLNGLKNRNEESSTIGFTNYVLIPYYSKRVPNTLRFIMSKIKGPNMRVTRKTKGVTDDKRSGPSPHSNISFSPTETLNFDRSSLMSSSRRPSLTRQSSTHSIKTLTAEALATKTNSNLSEFLQIDASSFRGNPATLTRTYSDMNNLQKRELKITSLGTKQGDLGASKIPSLSGKASGRLPETSSNTQRSFRRVGKPKNLANGGLRKFFSFTSSAKTTTTKTNNNNNNNEDIVQVLATPLVKRDQISSIKKLELREVVESPPIASVRKMSPSLSTRRPSSVYHSAVSTLPQLGGPGTPVQVFATPALKRSGQKVTSLEKIVEGTPLGLGETPRDIQEQGSQGLDTTSGPKPPPTKKVRRRLFGP